MPLRVYDNSDWRSPTSISIYDNSSWRTAKVGYVYDTGMWRVVFPDPIIPNIEISNYLIGSRASVYVDVLLTSSDYIVAELYLGTSQSTLVSSQTIDTLEDVFDSERITFTGLQNNTTYNMKITAYSITENTYTVLTGSATTTNVITPTASITSITNVSLNGVTVNWNSTNQYYWNIEIYRTSDGLPLTSRNPGPPPEPVFGPDDRSWTASFNAIANTQYTVKLTVESISEDPAVSFSTFTTPNVIQPTLSSLTATSTCNSITVNWSGSNYVSGIVQLWFPDLQIPSQQWTWGSLQRSSSFTSSTLSSYTFNGLPSSTLYVARIILVSSTSTELDSDSVFTWPSGFTSGPGEHPFITTLAPSVNPPTNFTGSSNFYGSGVNLSWTAATGNCTSVTGYNVEYKLTSSGTWLSLVNGITATSANTTLYVTLTANTSYDFRVQATGGGGIVSGYATTSVTTNNNIWDIDLTPASATITTFSSLALAVQLKNVSGVNISQSGVTINWSSTSLPGSSFTSSSTTTDSSGQATNTFSTGSSAGFVTITAQAAVTGTPSDASSVTVSLSTGQSVSLSPSGTTKGASFTNSVHSASYSYTNTPGYPTVGSLESGDSYNNSQFDILTSRTRDQRPVVSKSGTTATTTNTTFLANPLVSMAIRSSRTGYTTVDGPVAAITAGVTITSRTYQWQQFTGGTWNTSFGGAFSGTTSQTMSWSNTTFTSRQIRCNVTTNFSNGGSETSTSDNTVTIP